MSTHLINSRDTIIFDLLANEGDVFLKELHYFDKIMKEKLISEKIDYKKLKNILSPGNKGDIAFVFDWTKIEDAIYGEYILNLLIPYLHDNNFCYLHGDYCIYSVSQLEKDIKIEQLKKALYEEHNSFSDPSSYYIVYITNLGIKKAKTINKYLKEKEISYIGFSDLNLNNLFKTLLSTIIIQSFIKYNKTIIESNPDVEYIEKNECPNFVTLKNYDYQFLNINSHYYDIFLEYRIPSTMKQNDKDLYYSLKYLNNDINYKLIEKLKITISDDKILYLLNKKDYILNKWGLNNIVDIRNFLTKKIKASLLIGEIFDLDFMNEYNVYKFNIYIEYLNKKYKIGLKLLIDKKELFFLTLTSINK